MFRDRKPTERRPHKGPVKNQEKIADKGISAELLNIHTIKPLDEEAILASVAKTGCIVTAEEHQINGGLGESIAGVLARKNPKPIKNGALESHSLEY